MADSGDEDRLHSLVVVGSSAGGIEALVLLVAMLPPDFPVPLVIAQHLDPSRESHLGDILMRRSALPVRTVSDTGPQPLTPGTVYVVPADRDVAITDHTLRLHADATQYPKPSVDLLLSSAARAYGERLIAVILTGSGSDGAAGAREVKLAGGTVIIENPETASYPSMPASLAPTSVDIVANLDQIGPLLCDLLTGRYVPNHPEAIETLQTLLEHVRMQSGIDFNQYKRPTILRRLQRRMAATGTVTIHEYLQYVQRHPEEYGRLIASFLINVTAFFRDQELFTYLREEVLPDVLARAPERAPEHEVRIWSAGCATGEEAFSVAILLAEILGDELDRFNIRIFATDIDADAVAFARRGIYPAAALTAVTDELKSRYFVPVEDGYEISKRVRGLVVFGEHDLGQRAPFPHTDLVLCRNVLIYFTTELQKRALHLFAFSLRDGGYLVLGNSETTSPLAHYFAPAQSHLKIYRRRGERVLAPPARNRVALPVQLASPTLAILPPRQRPDGHLPTKPERPRGQGEWSRIRTSREKLGTQILGLPIGVVVINREYDVQTINSAAYRLLDINRTAIDKDLLHLAERVPTAPLRAAIDAAFAGVPVADDTTTTVVETTQTEPRTLEITCYPSTPSTPSTPSSGDAQGDTAAHSMAHSMAHSIESVLLLISDVTTVTKRARGRRATETITSPRARVSGKRGATPDAGRRRAENARATRQLDEANALIRELRAANLELQSKNLDVVHANEDLLIGQEEAQAASEEVKTLYEEMQASNEELETLNEEMEATVEELHTTNDDLQARSKELQRLVEDREEQRQASERERARLAAILLSMADALLVVDADGRTTLTNDAYRQLFGDRDDASVLDLEDSEGHALLAEAAPRQRARAGSPFRMDFTMLAPDGERRWFEARGQPVQSEGIPQGGVVSIRDITDQSLRGLQEGFMAMVSHELRSPLTSTQGALQLLARQFRPNQDDHQDDHLDDSGRKLVGIALRQMRQLQLLVDDLSDLGRIQRGEFQFTFQPIDMVELMEQLVDSLSLISIQDEERRRIELLVDPASRPMRISGDPVRVEQIVTNLLTNAMKYAHGSEHIDVRLQQVDDMVELAVRDDGAGIPAADLPHLFSRFYQVMSTRSQAQGGVGLGLFITQALVKAHSGSIAVRSTKRTGTTFTVRFPLLQAAHVVVERGAGLSSHEASDRPS